LNIGVIIYKITKAVDVTLNVPTVSTLTMPVPGLDKGGGVTLLILVMTQYR